MRDRPWRWFATRLFGLLNRPVMFGPTGQPIYTSRIQAAVMARYTPPPAADTA